MTPRKNSLIDYSPVCISSSDDDIFCIMRKLWKLSKPSFKLKVQEIRGQRKYETTYESCAVPVCSASFCSNGNGSNMLCRCFRFLFLSPLSQSLVNLDLFYVMTLDWHVKDSSANSALPVATKMASFPEADFLPTQLQRALHCAPFPAQFLSLKNCQLVAVFWLIKQIAQKHLWQKRKSETIRSLIVHDNGDHLCSIPDNVSLAKNYQVRSFCQSDLGALSRCLTLRTSKRFMEDKSGGFT